MDRHEPKKKAKKASTAVAKTEQIVFTVRPETGEVLTVEAIDVAGKRHELSDEECADLADDTIEEREELLELSRLLERTLRS